MRKVGNAKTRCGILDGRVATERGGVSWDAIKAVREKMKLLVSDKMLKKNTVLSSF